MLDSVADEDFDQNECTMCIIGNAMKRGILQKKNEFWTVVRQIELPYLDGYGFCSHAFHNYLFDGRRSILFFATFISKKYGIRLPHEAETPKHAQARIKALLEAAGF